MTIDLSDYITVDERIALFYAKYPEGSLQGEWVYIEGIGITYKAFAYRTPDDPRPGIGHASEPVPGLTPYTKNSELANCETSAWGRAIVALGIGAKKGIASQEDVRNRSGNGQTPDRGPKFTGSSSEIPAAPKTMGPAKNTDTGWDVMKERLTGLQGAELLDQWFTLTGYPRMTAQMWGTLTLPNRKICLGRALDLLEDVKAVAS